MSCNDDDVDSVLLARADVREGEDAEVTARPRAALAISCLSDEPKVSQDVAVRLIDGFFGMLKPDDDESPPRTIVGQSLHEVGASLWGPLVARRITMAWLAAPVNDGLYGGSAAVSISRTAPREEDEEGLRTWLDRDPVPGRVQHHHRTGIHQVVDRSRLQAGR